MKLNLQHNVTSPQDFTALVLEIRQYAEWLAHSTVKARRHISSACDQPIISAAASTLMQDWFNDHPLSPESLSELIGTLDNLANMLPRITITLAAPPPNSIKTTLTAWCREHIAPDILVDFRFNTTLLGGMVVQYGSHVYDWSFRRQILAARAKFPEALRRV